MATPNAALLAALSRIANMSDRDVADMSSGDLARDIARRALADCAHLAPRGVVPNMYVTRARLEFTARALRRQPTHDACAQFADWLDELVSSMEVLRP